ncbi:hypothetical protein ACC771_19600, partial [Rhizobium ruizarguesonis]
MRGFYDLRVLASRGENLEKWIGELPSAAALPAPHFFDNRTRSLLAQLPVMVKTHAKATARNHISMGAGFYEAPS